MCHYLFFVVFVCFVLWQVTLRHDVSRIVQSIFQFGSPVQRTTVLTELLPKFIEISKTPYGHFAAIKAITHCLLLSDQRAMVSALTGHFVALGCNVIGARIVESVLQFFPLSLTRTLKAEFYGKVKCFTNNNKKKKKIKSNKLI